MKAWRPTQVLWHFATFLGAPKHPIDFPYQYYAIPINPRQYEAKLFSTEITVRNFRGVQNFPKFNFWLIFNLLQNRPKISYEDVRGCKTGLPGPKKPKTMFSEWFRPTSRPNMNWPISADLSGVSTGINPKTLFPASLDPGDPFCTLARLHNLFCDDFETN